MFLLFGTKTKPEQKGSVKFPCSNCKRETIASIIEIKKFFTLFFIPLIPYGDKTFIRCNVCGFGGEIKENEKTGEE
jgi:hypothetical protein